MSAGSHKLVGIHERVIWGIMEVSMYIFVSSSVWLWIVIVMSVALFVVIYAIITLISKCTHRLLYSTVTSVTMEGGLHMVTLYRNPFGIL